MVKGVYYFILSCNALTMGGYVQNLQKAKQQQRFGALVMWSVWVVDVGIVSCRVRFPNPSLGRGLVGRWHPNKIQ
jgi:hypothetical protein